MDKPINGAPLPETAEEARKATSARISQQVDMGLSAMLVNLISQQPGEAGAILSGCMSAITTFTMLNCLPEAERRTPFKARNMLGDLAKHYADRFVADAAKREKETRG